MEKKLIAFCSVDYNDFRTGNMTNPVTKVFTSFPLDSKEEAEEWIKSQIERYPEASLNNSYTPGCRKHLITGYVAYDPDGSENFERILKILTTRVDDNQS